MKEQWKAIPGFEGSYEISNFGSVRSLERHVERGGPNGTTHYVQGGLMTPQRHNKGYRKVSLSGTNYFIHRLVLLTFIGPAPADKPQTRHLDGDPTNNRLTNLRWACQAENEDDKRYSGTYHRRGPCYA